MCMCAFKGQIVSGCTAVLLNTQARGLCSTGSVQRDGGMQETERGRVDGCVCVKVQGENRQCAQTHVILQIYAFISFLSFYFPLIIPFHLLEQIFLSLYPSLLWII